MEQNDMLNSIEQLKNGEITQILIHKVDFLTFRQIIVNRDDFKHFRGIAGHGGDVIYTYMKEARS